MVAYDSSYEDNEDGWSLVGVCGAELVGRTDGASLGAPGRFGLLVETIDDDDDHKSEDVLGDEFFDCPCDDPGFRFVIREEKNEYMYLSEYMYLIMNASHNTKCATVIYYM